MRAVNTSRGVYWMVGAVMLSFGAACGADESSDGLGVDESYERAGPSGEQSSDNAQESTGNNGAPAPQPSPGRAGDYDYGAPAEPRDPGPGGEYQDGETYDETPENDFIEAAAEDTSTFSIDVDAASYTLMRRDIRNGQLPAPESVRPEEFINYFDYGYPQPEEDAFSINMEVAPSRFGQDLHLMRIGVQGRDVGVESMKPNNLVFLIDVSGSMQSERKLGLVKKSLSTLLEHLRPSDRVGIVVYAGADGVVLDSTLVSDRAQIEQAIEDLRAGGSTNAEAGIVSAYQMAEAHKVEGGNNRVIILTDGDFNVGKRGEDLIEYIGEQRDRHISITCMGYGLGNYNDYHMENIAKEGNGNYFYVDSLEEAERVFGTNLPSTLEVIASDVKIQVEFNAEAVTRYRLVGYANRVLDNEDFRDDTKDAGEIGPGHSVTAYYELELAQGAAEQASLAEVRVRHKSQYGEASTESSQTIKMSSAQETFEAASGGFQFGAAVAEYAEILRQSKHSEGTDFAGVRAILEAHGANEQPDRQELLELVTQAEQLHDSI